MTASGAVQRSYTDADKGAALFGLDLNGGVVKTTAEALDIPRSNLEHWDDKRGEPGISAARQAISDHKNVQDLAEQFFELARRAIHHSMANLDKATPYHGALIAAISLDKWALITGRPTSRTEVLRARYVEPTALRELARKVIDVPLTGTTQPRRRSRKPKDVGV